MLWSHGGPLVPLGYHTLLYSQFFRPGFWGVTLFFSISGFLIIGQLLDMASGRRNESLRVFVYRRCLRTMPTYWLTTLLVLVCGLAAWPGGKQLLANLLFIQDFAAIGSVLPVAWSLVIEVWSYLLFAALAWGSRALAARASRLVRSFPLLQSWDSLLLLSLVCLPIVAAWIRLDWAVDGVSVQEIKQSFAPQIDALAYGGMLAWLQRYRLSLFERLARLEWLAPACLLLMALATATVPDLFIAVQQPVQPQKVVWLAVVFYPCAGLLASLLLLSLWGFRYAGLPAPLATMCRWLSRCSYSVYLLHVSLAAWLTSWGSGLGLFATYIFGSIMLGALGWRVLEQPFTRLRYLL